MKKEFPRYDKKLKRKNGKVISQFNKIEKELSPKNRKIINEFLEYCKINSKSEIARKARQRKILQIYDIMEKSLSSITLKDLRGFLVVVNNSSLLPSTQNDVKSILKRFLRWYYKNWSEKFDDFRDIKMKDERNHEKINSSSMLTEKEIEMLIRCAESLRHKALIMLMFESGGRPEEILKLKWEDIDFENKRVKLYSIKTQRTRVNELKEAIIHLERYQQEYPFPEVKNDDFIFPSPRNRNKRITSSAFAMYLSNLGKNANIKKRVWPYLLRHTRLSPLIQDLSPKAYEKFAGHALDTGMYYYGHLSESKLSAEILKKVYHIEEPTPKQKHKLQQQIDGLKETNELIRKELNMIKGLIFKGTNLEMDMYITQNSKSGGTIKI